MRTRRLLLVVAALAVGLAAWGGPAHAAAWCGTASTGDRPDVVGGNPFRVVYALASDAPDDSAEVAPRIWADVEAIDTWWRTQDPTRTPRFDQARFTCGDQVDLMVVRLPFSSEQLAPTEERFDLFVDGVISREDPAAAYTKYLVYYGGPVEEPRVCGQGGGSALGPGIAVVFTGACQQVPTAPTAAHEMLHAMGAVSSRAPNVCEDSAHVCDTSEDLMYPFASGLTLDAHVLDVGRDDYYGHAGTWLDVRTSNWLRRLDAQAALAVGVSGRGSVTSDVPGVDCTRACTVEWNAGTRVTLSAAPAAGQRFLRWTGACSSVTTCTVTLDQSRQVGAVFAPAGYRLVVNVRGKGIVRSRPAAVACSGRCSKLVPADEPLLLVATPRKNWRFARWLGGCQGSRPTCALPMSKATAARAVFVKRTP